MSYGWVITIIILEEMAPIKIKLENEGDQSELLAATERTITSNHTSIIESHIVYIYIYTDTWIMIKMFIVTFEKLD